MALRLTRDKNFLTGAVFAGIGAVALWFDQAYELGSVTAMGPGYFPMLIGALLIVLGLVNIARSLRGLSGSSVQLSGVRALGLLVLGVVLFGVCIDRFGLLPSVLLLVICATGVGVRYRMWEVTAILLVLCLISGALFVFGMGLPASYLARL
jgi:hypothetical protein